MRWIDNLPPLARRVGFRTFAMVTGNDTDPAYVAAAKGGDGTDQVLPRDPKSAYQPGVLCMSWRANLEFWGSVQLGMLWRINGAAIFSKGGNMIPVPPPPLLHLSPAKNSEQRCAQRF